MRFPLIDIIANRVPECEILCKCSIFKCLATNVVIRRYAKLAVCQTEAFWFAGFLQLKWDSWDSREISVKYRADKTDYDADKIHIDMGVFQ